jgi:hypothetical protein
VSFNLVSVSHHLIVMLNVIMLSAAVLRAVLPYAILLNVAAPIFFQFFTNFSFFFQRTSLSPGDRSRSPDAKKMKKEESDGERSDQVRDSNWLPSV